MIFPHIIFSGLFSPVNAVPIELWQRAARERLRRIEQAVTHNRTVAGSQDSYIDEYGLINFDQIIMELATCHTEVLKKSPSAYLRVLDGFDDAMALFEMHSQRPSPSPHVYWNQHHTHSMLSSRIDFYQKKLHGQEQYQSTTLQRLEVQRSLLSMCCGQIDNRVSFQIASAQTKLAHSSKREAVSQKAIAILGTVFLPGAYLSVRTTLHFHFPLSVRPLPITIFLDQPLVKNFFCPITTSFTYSPKLTLPSPSSAQHSSIGRHGRVSLIAPPSPHSSGSTGPCRSHSQLQ
jgi:hypothetical protein